MAQKFGRGQKKDYTTLMESRQARQDSKFIRSLKNFAQRTGDFLSRNMSTFVGIAAASVALTLVVGAVAFATVILPDKSGVSTVAVPDFVGTYYEDGDADGDIFQVNIQYEYDESAPAGVVLKQYPSAGLDRKVIPGERRCSLTLTVSRGRNTVMIPDLKGKTAQDATDTLDRLGLSVTTEYVSDASVPEGSVISTQPSAFSDVPAGGKVKIKVSGSAPVSIVMPALTGLNETEALERLAQLGLEAGKSDYASSDKPIGTVIAQSIPFGSTVTTKATVYLTVSLG